MSDWLLAYLALGVVVSVFDAASVAVECSTLTRYEQFLLFARITLSWPTYLVEDYLIWKDRDAD